MWQYTQTIALVCGSTEKQLYWYVAVHTNNCNGMWQYTQTSINSQLDKMVDTLYQKLNNKWTHYKDKEKEIYCFMHF